MNEMHIRVSFDNQICKIVDIEQINNDYNSTKLVFDFDREYEGRKVVEIRPEFADSTDATFAQEIINNQVILTREIDGQNYSPFTQYGEHILEVTLYGDNSKLTLIASKPFYVTQEEIGISNTQSEGYLPVFDQMMNHLNNAMNEVNNLDVDVSKVGNTATIQVTKKNGTTKSEQVSDGVGLDYDWDGTSLGVKKENEENYQYVDLKGQDGSCNFATFEINLTTGNLEMNKTEDMLLDFEIENGYLEVVI